MRSRRCHLAAVFLLALFVSVSAVGLAGTGAATAAPIEAESTVATESVSTTALHSVTTADRAGVSGFDTDPSTANTSVAAADTETYLVVLDEDLNVGPVRTAGDIDRAKRTAERAQAPVVDRLEAKGVAVSTQFWITNAVVTTVDPDAVTPAELKAIDGVTHVEPNVEFERLETQQGEEVALTGETTATTRESSETTYGLKQINLDGFSDAYDTNGSDTRVAVIDDGLNESHPDIEVTLGVNVSDGTVSDPATTTLQQDTGHGDHVAGTATGTPTPAGDVARYSVAPDAELLKADVFVDDARVIDILAAIEWAVEEDADVVSMSLGLAASDTDSTIILSMEDAIQNANDAGTVVIGSAGNEGSGATGGPVSSPGTEFSGFSIGATDSTGAVASFSSGAVISPDTAVVVEDGSVTSYPDHYPHTYVKPDVTAPGVDVLSAGPLGTITHENPTYSTASGTSMAAPHVAGAVALLQSATTARRDPHVLTNALAETASKPDETSVTSRDIRYGTGIIDVLAAREALDSTTTIEGTVTGDDDALTGATITTDSGVIAATDSGTYAIEPTTDAATVAVTANEYGYAPETEAVATGGSETLDFDLAEIESLRVELDADRIETTATTNLTVVAEHADGTESEISDEAILTSSNTSVATIDETTISGNEAGTTTITAQYDGFTAETTLEVREREGIKLSVDGQQDSISIVEQETVGYTIDAVFDDGSTEPITDSADLEFAPDQNDAALTIDTDAATITGTDPAENVTLVADDGRFEDTIAVTVIENELESITLALSESTVTTNKSVTATVTGTYTNGSERTITDDATITAADTDIATVDTATITGVSSGTTTLTATVDDKTATADLTVLDPEFFDVNVTQSPSTVVEGDPLILEYEVTNIGERTGSQNITVSVNGTEHTTTDDLQLDPSETATETVTYQTQSGDTPSLDVEIASANTSVTETVTVQTPPHFAVAIDSINDSVVEGETIAATYTVTNTGEATGTQDITLAINDTVKTTVPDVTLDGNTTTTETVTYQTQSGDAPSVDVSVASADATATESVSVKRPPRFAVAIDSINDSVVEGDTISVGYTVTNTGDVAGTQSVSLRTNGTTQNTTSMTLASGVTNSSTLQYQTQSGDAPALNVSIASDDTTATEVVTVDAPAEFAVTIDEDASTMTVTEPDPVVIAAEIENVGTLTGTESITYTLARDENVTATNTTNVTLSGQTTTTATFTTDTADLELGEYLATVDSETDTDTRTVTLEQEPIAGGATGGGGGGGGTSGDTSDDDADEPDDEETPSTSDPDSETDEEASTDDSQSPNESDTASDTTDDPDPTDDESETGADAPGFGVVVTLVAVLVAARLTTR